MSLTSGFYNSKDGDRRYTAEQMSEIFNGIINDGVFASVGTAFAVKADTGNTITVGVGRAWFNGTWIYNDSPMIIKADNSDIALDRLDVVVLEVDRRDSARRASIKIVKGSPSSSPEAPTLTKGDGLYQYPLAHILRKANSSEITQINIGNKVGTSQCPFVTGILKVVTTDHIVAQWEAQLSLWASNMMTDIGDKTDQQINENQTRFNSWFNGLQVVLDGDVATNLAAAVLDLQSRVESLEEIHFPRIADSNGEYIEDSNGDVIRGELVYKII